jgi:large subunit ribosomal protein L30
MAKLKVTQIKSTINTKKNHKRTIEALGLGRINRTKMHNDTPQIRGMIKTVEHLVTFEKVDE